MLDDSAVPITRNTSGTAQHTLEILDRAELTHRLRSRRAAARRHSLWAMLGLSPGALVPLIATAHEFGIAIAAACTVFVSGIEIWRAIQAHMDAQQLEATIHDASGTGEADFQQGSEAAGTTVGERDRFGLHLTTAGGHVAPDEQTH